MIHSAHPKVLPVVNVISISIDPLGRPTATAGRDHCFCTCRPFVRPSVRPHFSKQNKAITMFGETVDLAEWIIDDTCLVFLCFGYVQTIWVKIIIITVESALWINKYMKLSVFQMSSTKKAIRSR